MPAVLADAIYLTLTPWFRKEWDAGLVYRWFWLDSWVEVGLLHPDGSIRT